MTQDQVIRLLQAVRDWRLRVEAEQMKSEFELEAKKTKAQRRAEAIHSE